VLAELVAQVARHGNFNLLLSDGRALYAHASNKLVWLQRGHPFARTRLLDCDLEVDLAEANGPSDRMVLVATAPLTADEPWLAFAPGELRVFIDGRSVWQQGSRPESAAVERRLTTAGVF
jgi:glutamine amidotransferase